MKIIFAYVLAAGLLLVGCSGGTDETPPAAFDNINLIGPTNDPDLSTAADFIFDPERGDMEMSLDVGTTSEVGFRISEFESKRVIYDLRGVFYPGAFRLSWDGRMENGLYAPPGLYIRDIWVGKQHWSNLFRIVW
jgi:hypothetical protein